MGSPPSEFSITTTDGIKISYDRTGLPSGPTVVLIHGWSGSRHYWDLNVQLLARKCQVIAYDQRFHGASDKPRWGYHVARLAADLRDLLQALDLRECTVVGASMGASVIWAYIELFGHDRLQRCVFVDQAPLQPERGTQHCRSDLIPRFTSLRLDPDPKQNLSADWKLGSKTCFDTASLTRLQCALAHDYDGFAASGGEVCLSKPIRPEVGLALVAETRKADPDALSRLMADHTQIRIPCLMMIGRKSGIFPWEGCNIVSTLIPTCHTVTFEHANHWLYVEEPEKFSSLVRAFALEGLQGVQPISSV